MMRFLGRAFGVCIVMFVIWTCTDRHTVVCNAADAVRRHDSFSTVLPDCKFACHVAEAPAVSVFN
jgi:hypothetical protein